MRDEAMTQCETKSPWRLLPPLTPSSECVNNTFLFSVGEDEWRRMEKEPAQRRKVRGATL